MSKSPPDPPIFPSDSADPSGKKRPAPGPLPRCRLVLVRSAADNLVGVVRAIMDLTRYGEAEATHRMWEAHHSGRSLVLTTHRERAELFVEQFAGRGVTVVVEPM
jgi:ATP-dependent Clp protease adaptor protein ClpS